MSSEEKRKRSHNRKSSIRGGGAIVALRETTTPQLLPLPSSNHDSQSSRLGFKLRRCFPRSCSAWLTPVALLTLVVRGSENHKAHLATRSRSSKACARSEDTPVSVAVAIYLVVVPASSFSNLIDPRENVRLLREVGLMGRVPATM